MGFDELEDRVLDGVQKLKEKKELVDGAVSKAMDLAQQSGNPMIQHTINIVQSVLDIGNQVPYVGPICSVLTFIIQIEIKAREAEKKCTDLVERINFMVGHLSALENITVLPATELVLQKMNDVLKSAAGVIQTYRKQSKVSRRLNLGNKEKFESCFSSIEKCSADLMFSLQIHQTHKLDELSKRKEDELDLQAEKFIREHGGIENIKKNEELVKQFASETKLTVDETVMQELNTSISSLLIENQAAMENILKKNLSTEISKGFEEFAKLMVESDNEEQLSCVQCGDKFKESKNPAGSCNFHISPYSSRGKFNCCGSDAPCQHKKHRSAHHNDYPYSKLFERMSAIFNYTNTWEKHIEISDEGLESDLEIQMCDVGKLYRWSTDSYLINVPTLVVKIGPTKMDGPNYFNTFDLNALKIISECYKSDKNKLIYRNHEGDEEYSYAEWIFDENSQIIGVLAGVKSQTSSIPTVEKVLFDPETLEMVSNERLSTQFFSYMPATPYNLPKTVSVGRTLPEARAREVRTDFKTYGELQPYVYFSLISPIMANDPNAFTGQDCYIGKISIFNKTKDTVVIMKLGCDYRLVGDEEYKRVKEVKFDVNCPIALDPLKAVELEFTVKIERDPKDPSYNIRVWNEDYMSRDRPLRIRFNATDMEDRVGHFVVEYLRNFSPRQQKRKGELDHLVIEDYERISRYTIAPSLRSDDSGISIGYLSLDFDNIDKIVYDALKRGITELPFDKVQDSNFDWFEHKFYGLIDPNCKRMYAVKVLLTQKEGKSAVLGYVPLPLYGENKETRPIKYAHESVKFPIISPPKYIDYPNNDDVDDRAQQKPAKAIIPSVENVLNIQSIPTPEFKTTANANDADRLKSIDENLTRTANAIEQLVGIFYKLSKDREIEKQRMQYDTEHQRTQLNTPSSTSLNDLPAMVPSTEFAEQVKVQKKEEEIKLSMCF
ncbi:hypothetical protein HDV06_005848 [Boothiomyces sp. JEL0866]|nr:hypothetical protein HDV06_005848 [Boothiomyces sp. JEL0866]